MPTECTSNPLQRELADSLIRYAPIDDLRILLACGASPNEPVTQGLRPLHYAVWQRYEEAVHFLLVRGSDVNARDDCGYTALHLSAEHGYLEIMKILLEYQAKVNVEEKTEETGKPVLCEEPLRLALKNGHYECVQFLLEHGANPNTRYFLGSEINLVNPLNTKFLDLLLAFGAHVDSRDRTGMTPLMKACRQPRGMESALVLISYGADVNAVADERQDYRSVLHYAVLSGNHDIVSILLKQGARPMVSPNDGHCRSTALDMAIVKGDAVLVKMLIEAGADVNFVSSVLGSPLHVAMSDGVPNRYEIVRILLDNGADPNIVVRSEEGLLLQPVLSEYISSNEKPQQEIVDLLLRHSTKVVLKSQHRDPLGMLSILPTLSKHREIFLSVVEAAQSFDYILIKRLRIAPDLREYCMQSALNPPPLKQVCRLYLRQHLRPHFDRKVCEMEIPTILKSYLLFENS